MLQLRLPTALERPLRVICLGAHSDDIEIGCGGTILRLLQEHPNVRMHWVVFSAQGERAEEARASADRFLATVEHRDLSLHDFRDGFFPAEYVRIKETLEAMKAWPSPDLIFTHHGVDRHQDHRVISELTWNTFRDHLILEYEIPKYDGGLATPNVFVELDEATRDRKVTFLLKSFPSQRSKPWFSQETFLGLMRIRGVENACPSGYAEGFHARKLRVRL